MKNTYKVIESFKGSEIDVFKDDILKLRDLKLYKEDKEVCCLHSTNGMNHCKQVDIEEPEHSLEVKAVEYASGTVIVETKEGGEKLKLKPSDIVIKATIKEEVKNELGNKDGFYNGEWKVISFDHRDEEIWLSNGGCSICRKYNEVDIIG
jgi:hypothetical protein